MATAKKLTIGIPTGMPSVPPLQVALDVAHEQIFPLLKIVFAATNKKQTSEVTVEVSPSMFKLLTETFTGNETIVFLTPGANVPLGVWGREMIESFKLLSKIGLFSSFDIWLTVARERISKMLGNEKSAPIQPTQSTQNAVTVSGQILKQAGLLTEVESNDGLTKIARDVLQSGKMDLDTAIYRLSMAIYHTPRISGEPLLPALEDPAKIYLDFISDPSARSQFKEAIDIMEGRESVARQEFVRTFMCIVVAVYVCNKVLLQGAKS